MAKSSERHTIYCAEYRLLTRMPGPNMTNETFQAHSTDTKTVPFGARLTAAREKLGMERKDAAAQLRLSENIIAMLETENYPADLPITFLRGYLRSYSKLLNIPEHEVRKAIEPIKPKPTPEELAPIVKPQEPVTTGNYFVQIFTYLIVFTMFGLVGMWWYSHSATPNINTDRQIASLPELPSQASAPTPAATIVTADNSATNKTAINAPTNTTQTTNPAPTTTAAAPATTTGTTATAPTQQPAPQQNNTNQQVDTEHQALNTNDIQAESATTTEAPKKVPVVASSKHKKQVIVEDLSDDNDSDNDSHNNEANNSDYAD